MALPKGMAWNRSHVFDLDVDSISHPSKRARVGSEENDFIEIEWTSMASGFCSLNKRPNKTAALGLIQPNGHRVEEGGMKRKRKDLIGQQFQWPRITLSSLRPEVDSQALLQPQSLCRTMGPGIDHVTQLMSVAEKVKGRSPEFDQNQSLIKPYPLLSLTSFHDYISKKNARPPTAEVTTSSEVHSDPSGINLNNAETTVTAALHPVLHPSVAITTTQQHEGIKTEQPEHKVTSSVHPKSSKKEPETTVTAALHPVLHPSVAIVTTTTQQQHEGIKTKQPEHKVTSSVHPKSSKKEPGGISIQRPTIESKDWLHHKRAYLDMVRRHMNEHIDDEQTSITHLKTELLKLMTLVAGQSNSDGMQWQHPSDLTSRNCQVRFRNLKPSFSLHEWQKYNNGHQRRFYKLPNNFERSPID